MKKLLKGRLLSGALATALTVTNMGMLIPMTAYAAAPSGASAEITLGTATPVATDVYDIGETDLTATYTFAGDVADEDAGTFTMDVAAGGKTTIAAATLGQNLVYTVEANGTDDTNNTIEGKFDFSAITDKSEEVTVRVLYTKAGTTTPEIIAKKTFNVKTAATTDDLQKNGVVKLSGKDKVFTKEAVDLTLDVNLPKELYVPAATHFFVAPTTGTNVITSAMLDTSEGSSLAYTGGQQWDYVTAPKVKVTPTAKGTGSLTIYADVAGTADTTDAIVATKGLEITESAPTKISVEGKVKNIPVKSPTQTTYTIDSKAMELKATEEINSNVGAEDIKWEVYAKSDTTYRTDLVNSGKFAVIGDSDGHASVPATATKYEETVTIEATGAPEEDYVVRAVAETTNTVYGTYGFSVVDPKAISIEGSDETADANSAYLYSDSTDTLKFFYGGSQKTSGIKWAVQTADKDIAEIGETTGSLKAKAVGTAKIDVTYKINDDMSVTKTAAYTATISNATLVVDIDDYDLEVGDTAKATLRNGNEVITSGVTWEADSVAASIDNDGVITANPVDTDTVVIFTATYVKDGVTKTVTNTTTFTVHAPTYEIYDSEGEKVTGTTITKPLVTGKTLQLTLGRSDGSTVAGDVVWTTTNSDIAGVSNSGLVTAGKTAGSATITAEVKVSGAVVTSKTVTVKVAAAAYTISAEEKELSEDDLTATPVEYSVDMYYGDTLTLSAFNDEEEISGEWRLTTNTGSYLALNGNVISTTKAVGSDQTDNGIVQFTQDNGKTYIAQLTISSKADAGVLYKDGEELPALNDTIALLEQGESVTYSVKYGSKDVTSLMKWEPKGTSLTVENGKITAVGEGRSAVVEGKYIVNDVTLVTVTITVDKIVGSTGAAEAADEAITQSTNAVNAAGAATDAADEAAKAAEATKAAPTAENLAKAENALNEAKTELKNAQEALAAAQEAYAAAEAAGARSESADAMVKRAEEEVAIAEAAVADAEKNVAAAQKTFDEAATEVEKAKKAEEEKKKQEEEQKKSDGSAANTPAPVGNELKDADGNATGFVVTKATAGAAEVEYKGLEADKTAKKVTIPNEVKDQNGNAYKVTSIAANALKNAKGKEIVINKNIKKIGRNAMKGAKFTKITLKTDKKGKVSIGKGAFKTSKKATIKIKGCKGENKDKLVKKVKKQANKKSVVK